MAALTALAAMLLSPTKGEAAATHTVTYDALGGDKGNISANKGDTVIFKNALPLQPLTGAVAPVNMIFGGETFQVAGTPVARTITTSTSYTGTYSVLGLVPLTSSSGTITAANAPPPPPPPAPQPPPPPPPGEEEPPAPPPDDGNNPPTTPGGGAGPIIPPGDPGNVPGGAGSAGSATVPQPGSGTANGQAPGFAEVPPAVVAPNSGSNTTLVPGNGQSSNQRTMSNSSTAAGGLGLTAMLGAILLLGVGIALARTLISGRLNSATAA